jgi:hypothetical protein
MNFLEKYNLNFTKIAKGAGIALLAIVALYVLFGFLNGIMPSSGFKSGQSLSSPSFGGMAYSSDAVMDKSASMALSSRNMIDIEEDFSSGMNAEDFEVTEYRAMIETRNLKESCNLIMSLKTKDYVIFENSNQNDNNCNFRFKVKKDNVEEVLELVKSLDPRELNENIETIKKQIEDFTSEEEILKRKLKTIDDTLESAIVSYDEISKLATQTRDANSLASIIESKIRIIERLSKEKINVSAQLDRISKSKSEKLDKLEYTYFNVNIYENKYIDIKTIKDSWKSSIKSFVRNLNKIVQDISIGLITLIAYIIQYLLYLFIFVFTAKYVWKLLKRIWKS